MTRIRTTTLAVAVLLLSGAAASRAQTFDQTHPRRAEVNNRLATQNGRIRQGVADGQISPAQAAQLHANDRAIRSEERADAAGNGGHITKAEQRHINRQENTDSAAIRDERH